jgi:IMP dehydrogenase
MSRKLEPDFVGKTYDDFLFRPQPGVVTSRREVSLKSRLSKHLELELPVLSANMDSVTGTRMAKTLALEGGIGFLHRAMSIEAQADSVRQMKRSQGYIVEHPLCLPRDATIREVKEFTQRHNITGILIEETRGSKVLAGLLSNRDMPWTDHHLGQKVEQFMTPVEKLQTAHPGVSMEEAERIMFEHRIEKLPLIDRDRHIQGLITQKDISLSRQRPYSSRDEKGRLLVGAAIGARGDFLERAQELIGAQVDVILIDIAHGHTEVMRRAVEGFRRQCGDVELVCGNVGTTEGAIFLRDLGADAIKVGIGPGRGCRTRLETAAGVPQLQALREAWCAVEESVPIIADGGIKNDKDIFLGMICGASSVMLGSALSGTDEAPGHVIENPATRQKSKIYRGMTSPQAVFERLYAGDDPEAVEAALDVPAEGQEVQIPYQGSVVDILQRIRGHLRSAVSYGGGNTLADVRAKVVSNPTQFLIPLSPAARSESYER